MKPLLVGCSSCQPPASSLQLCLLQTTRLHKYNKAQIIPLVQFEEATIKQMHHIANHATESLTSEECSLFGVFGSLALGGGIAFSRSRALTSITPCKKSQYLQQHPAYLCLRSV